jgi:type IV secretory pathway VirB9-like protein
MTQRFSHLLLSAAFAGGIAFTAPAFANDPTMEYPSDSRIKILKYSASDIFTIYTLYGYQTNIEFANGEEVQTISVGDRSLWQIIPSANRLFIRPMDDNVSTNMTVITNLRTYQFDIKSGSGSIDNNPRMVYVARFTYPDKKTSSAEVVYIPAQQTPPISPIVNTPTPVANISKPLMTPPPAEPLTSITPTPTPQPLNVQPFAPQPMMSPIPPAPPPPPMDTQPQSTNSEPRTINAKINTHYTFTGPDELAPVQVYDDGTKTFIRFAKLEGALPEAKIITENGETISAPQTAKGASMALEVNTVAPRIILSYANDPSKEVTLYNEALGNKGGTHGK